MKNFSVPRLALVLFFLNYTIFSLFSYVWGGGRHPIMDFVVYATAWVVVELVCLGLIEDVM
ncbi:MAG TPA: hypothetical protein VIJ93_10620 [bacterium]